MRKVRESENSVENMYVLRDKKTRKPLNIAMTVDGLKYTANKMGKALYFKNAFFRNGNIEGDLAPSDRVVIEKFQPNTERNYRYLKEELTWLKKANALNFML